MKKILLLISLMFISAACGRVDPAQTNACFGQYDKMVRVSNNDLCIQIVISGQDMQKGLSGRVSMESNEGMLFVTSGQPAFWMKDMKLDLDLIWVKDNKIISITKNVPAPRNAEENQDLKLPTYSPPSDVDHVLEVNAGWSDRNEIKINDKIDIIEQK